MYKLRKIDQFEVDFIATNVKKIFFSLFCVFIEWSVISSEKSQEDAFKKIERMKESVIEDEGFKKYLKEYKEKKDDDTELFDVLLMF